MSRAPALTPDPGGCFALVLAGGGGTRLWPASRRARPKQLLSLGGPETLLFATCRRTVALVGAANTLVVTAADQAEAIRAAIPLVPAENIITEPAPRNTLPAIMLGAAVMTRRLRETSTRWESTRFAVFPSDAHIGDEAAFFACVRLALQHAQDAIVTIGITPDRPETGYGYVQPGRTLAPGVVEVARFVEKPDEQTARHYLAGGYLWNAGMFFLTVGRLQAEVRRHAPEIGQALEALLLVDDFLAQRDALYPRLPAVSIDYGIMEKTAGIRAVTGAFGWSDVGSWAALGAVRAPDADGNVRVGETLVHAARGNVIVSEPGGPLIAATGVEDLVIVATRDAILVTRKDRAQSVRQVVEMLQRADRADWKNLL